MVHALSCVAVVALWRAACVVAAPCGDVPARRAFSVSVVAGPEPPSNDSPLTPAPKQATPATQAPPPFMPDDAGSVDQATTTAAPPNGFLQAAAPLLSGAQGAVQQAQKLGAQLGKQGAVQQAQKLGAQLGQQGAVKQAQKLGAQFGKQVSPVTGAFQKNLAQAFHFGDGAQDKASHTTTINPAAALQAVTAEAKERLERAKKEQKQIQAQLADLNAKLDKGSSVSSGGYQRLFSLPSAKIRRAARGSQGTVLAIASAAVALVALLALIARGFLVPRLRGQMPGPSEESDESDGSGFE